MLCVLLKSNSNTLIIKKRFLSITKTQQIVPLGNRKTKQNKQNKRRSVFRSEINKVPNGK